MPSHTASVAPAAEPAGAAAQVTSVVPALYRAALGSLNADHYLRVFERLDAIGRVLPGWNLAAALCPLGWMLFRRLWRHALLLVAGLLAAALLLWAAYLWLDLPRTILAGVAMAGWFMLCGGLGLYGDALMHANVRRRIAGAVSAAPNMREAMNLLQREAASRRRLTLMAALGAAALLALVSVWLGLGDKPVRQPVSGGVLAVPALEPEPAPAPAPAVQASNEPAVAEPAPAPAAIPRAPAPVQAEEPPATQEPAQPQSTPLEAAAEPPPAPLAHVQAPAAVRQPTGAAQRRLYINVGLFADLENARRTHARLRQAGLPAAMDPLVRADGRRLQRVRVGPFTSAAQANAAAARVRALGLEAVATAQ